MASELKKYCPLIKRIPTTGGMMSTMPSAAEDMTLSFNDSNARKFKFSKFALLKIPDILNRQFENKIKLNSIPGAYNSVNFERTTDYNIHLIESLQNYALNLETMIISDNNYDPNEDKTVSERVLFKWLKEIGALRFSEVKNVTFEDGNKRFTEEAESDNYEHVIKYIGNIDVVNNLSGQANSYTEVYIHIPTEVGSVPNVLFETLEDANYSSGMTFCKTGEGLNNEIIAGRSYSDVHPDNLDIHAFYDN